LEASFMIEPIMYFGIGFLVAALIGLIIIPLVHNRAVRLTMRRLEAATPLSMAEIQADKDQLRAEFAMSTRRLEMSVEQLKGKSTNQLAELGKKTDAINRLKIELGEKTATIFALEARDKAMRDQLRATEEEFAVKTNALHEAQRTLSDKEDELRKLINALDERSVTADSQKVEIVALKTQVDALKDRLTQAGDDLKVVEDRRDAERLDMQTTSQRLAEERGKVENLGHRVGELEQQLVAQTTEAELLGRRAQDLESRLNEQSRLLTEGEFELKHMRSELEVTRKAESDLRTAIIEIDGRSNTSIQQLRAEKADLQVALDRANEERTRLTREIADMKRQTEESWASERVENAMMRERINDVAAEVARLASTLEGPNSPIDAILAAETLRDRIGSRTAPARTETNPATGNLAERIRALQTRASRVPHGGDPSRN
jgi:chromosome segregation ATPase